MYANAVAVTNAVATKTAPTIIIIFQVFIQFTSEHYYCHALGIWVG
jgi:hypothetical protein